MKWEAGHQLREQMWGVPMERGRVRSRSLRSGATGLGKSGVTGDSSWACLRRVVAAALCLTPVGWV